MMWPHPSPMRILIAAIVGLFVASAAGAWWTLPRQSSRQAPTLAEFQPRKPPSKRQVDLDNQQKANAAALLESLRAKLAMQLVVERERRLAAGRQEKVGN